MLQAKTSRTWSSKKIFSICLTFGSTVNHRLLKSVCLCVREFVKSNLSLKIWFNLYLKGNQISVIKDSRNELKRTYSGSKQQTHLTAPDSHALASDIEHENLFCSRAALSKVQVGHFKPPPSLVRGIKLSYSHLPQAQPKRRAAVFPPRFHLFHVCMLQHAPSYWCLRF